MGPVHLILFLLAISAEGILAASPCNQTFTGNVTVSPGDILLNVTNCTFTFSINTATGDTLMLVFSSLGSLGSGDNITISAENKIIANITSDNDPVTVVSTSDLTVVTILKESGKNVTFNLVYKKVCEQEVDPLSGFLASPKYLPLTKKTIVCTYNVMSPEGLITLLGFADFTINSSSLTVNGKNVTAADKKLPDDLLIPSNTSIVLNIPNTEKTVEGFSLILSLVNNDCSSKAFSVSNLFSYNSSSAAVCHLMVDAPNPSDTLVATVKSWQTDLTDQLQFRDGFSQGDSPLISGSSVQDNIMLVSSGSKMSVHLLFGRTSQRKVEISFTSQVYEGIVKVGGNITYDSAKSGGKDGVFQCTLDAGKKVSLTNFNMINNGTVEIYDGNLIKTPVFTITNTSLPIPVFMKSNQMTIVTKGASSGYNFTAVTGEARASDQFSQPELGTYAVKALGPNDTYTYNLIILPMPKEDYRGTLQVTSLDLCPGDKVTIFEGITTIDVQKELVEFTSNTTYQFIPQYIFAADKGARIVTFLSQCASRKAGDVILTASYDMKQLSSLCGKTPSSPSGSVTSPYYPLRYPLNLNCQWPFEKKNDSFLYISVDKLNITVGNSLKLTGKTEFNFTVDKTLGRDFIFSKTNELVLSFTYESQSGTLVFPGEGFVIKYQYLDCGGSTNANFSASLGGARTDCRWIISLPRTTQDSVMSNNNKSVYIINATLGVSAEYVAGSLIVYDGTSMNDEHYVNLTNLTHTHDLNFQSRVDTFIIQYVNKSANPKEFTLAVNITKLLCTKFCDNGICMHLDWMCNDVNDCGDNTDELHCGNGTEPTPAPSPSPPPKPAPQTDKGEVPGFWLAIMLIIGLIIGILLPFIIPAIVRRMRKRSYNRMTDMGNPEA